MLVNIEASNYSRLLASEDSPYNTHKPARQANIRPLYIALVRPCKAPNLQDRVRLFRAIYPIVQNSLF